MLKLNYTDDGPFLEQVLATSVDAIAAQRVSLAVHVGEPLHVGPSRASFLLSEDLPGLEHLKQMLQKNTTGDILLTKADENFVEISLKGTWIAGSANAESGTFITALTAESERLIYRLWQVAGREAIYFIG
ncbi:MAG: alr0857 family protein [Cyanobacteria bacterium P01_A01_bin.15]